MKMRIRRTSKSLISIILTLCMLLSCVIVGLVPTSAASVNGDDLVGGSWISYRRLYFGIPLSWDTSNFSKVYLASRETNDGGWTVVLAELEAKSADGRIYGTTAQLNEDHSSYKTEYAYIFATNTTYSKGDAGAKTSFTAVYDTSDSSQAVSDFNQTANTFFLYTESDAANGAILKKRWNNYDKLGYLGTDGTITNGQETPYAQQKTSCNTNTGESITISGYRIKENSSDTFEAHSSTSGQLGCIVGSKVTITAAPDSNHVLDGFYSDSSYTTKITDGVSGSTYTYSVTSPSDRTVYVKFNDKETQYAVTVESEDSNKGTVAAATVNAGATYPETIPTAVPAYGYKFKEWVATSPASIASNSTSASEATVLSTAAGGKVTATFEPDDSMQLYIAGRFHVQTGENTGVWKNSFSSGDWSNTGTEDTKLTFDSATKKYKLNTYASLKKLSDNISNLTPLFFVYDSTDAGQAVYWYAGASEKQLTSSVKQQQLTKNTVLENTGNNGKLRFNDQSEDKPVTVYFDATTGIVSYVVPDFYNITINNSIQHGSVTSSTSRTTAGTEVTLTPTADTGYQFGSWSVTDASNNPITVVNNKFTMPASNVTVSATFNEVIKKITVVDNLGNTVQSNIPVGIDTAAVLSAPPDRTDYTFSSWSVPSTLKITSGSADNNASITVKANDTTLTSDPAVTIQYTETLHDVTVQVSSTAAGKVTCGGTQVSGITTQIGNITYVSLTAENNEGYTFTHWEITPESGKTVTVSDGTNSQVISSATGATLPDAGNIRRTRTLQFKTNGTATVKAHFKATPYSLVAQFTHNDSYSWNSNTAVIVDENGDSLSEGVINQSFRLRVTLAPGYAIDGNIAFTSGTGYVTPVTERATTTVYDSTNNTKLVTYYYKMPGPPGKITARITLKAETPVISEVQIKTNSEGFPFEVKADSTTVSHYYKQPVVAKTTLENYFTQTAKVTYSNGSEPSAEYNSGAEGTLEQKTLTASPSENYTDTYTLTVTATNKPAGFESAPATATRTYTISVSYNDAQKAFVRIKNSLAVLVAENETGYYKDNSVSEIRAYNNKRSAADRYTSGSWPDYNESDETATRYEDELRTAYDSLMLRARTTKIYVLSKYAPTDSDHPIMLHTWKAGSQTDSDWTHFKMGAYFSDSRVGNGYDTQKMSFAGTFAKSGNRYLYEYTYKGRCSFIVYRGSSANDNTVIPGEKLTGDVSSVSEFGEYYIDVYDTGIGSESVTSATAYNNFDHNIEHQRVMLEYGQRVEGADLIALFGVSPSGSLCTSPGIETQNTSFTITGPVGAGSTPVELKSGNSYNAFTAARSGKYQVEYTTYFGKDKDNHDITKTATMSLWVEVDEVNVYVDMNDSIGNPILNFLYYTNSSGTPVTAGTAGAVQAFLPCEMDLVTGSSSIYKYTVKISTLKSYKVPFNADDSININYIIVENMYVNTDGKSTESPTGEDLTDNAFVINPEALITGEYWLKADSSNLKTFNTISYGSRTNTFLAVIEGESNAVLTSETPVLTSAIGRVYGTGIKSDNEDRVFHNQYAALYTLEGAQKPVYNFNYVQQTVAQSEVALKANTYAFDMTGGKYYFDRWVKFATPEAGITVDAETSTTDLSSVTYTAAGNSTDLDFTSAIPYEEGNKTYVALYKKAKEADSTVRVEITYKFRDYDTSDGNYIMHYTPEDIAGLEGTALEDKLNEKTVPAEYTKTVKLSLGTGDYSSFSDVSGNIQAIVNNAMPYVESRYFDYSYTNGTAVVTATKADESKIEVTAALKHTPHKYTIKVTNNGSIVSTQTGYYQQTVTLTSGSAVNWTDNNGAVLAANTISYTARYVTGSFAGGDADCQIIKQAAASGSTAHTSVIDNSYTEVFYDGTTEKLRHNFYIIDYSSESEFLGGGVLFATRKNNAYRQQGVGDVLDTKAERERFISGILRNDAATEYAPQTIDNIGFRYKPYNPKEDVFRYSKELSAYVTNYTGTNINSPNYEDQTLRVYSFMVYNNNGTIVVVCSDGYGEVSRYIPQS